jgi:hypothetical protein
VAAFGSPVSPPPTTPRPTSFPTWGLQGIHAPAQLPVRRASVWPFVAAPPFFPSTTGRLSSVGADSSGPRCGSYNGSSSRPVASVGRGSLVRSAAPRIRCVPGPSKTELAAVAREGLGLDPSWFDPMCEEVAACRRLVPHDAPRLFPPVAQVVPRHPPVGALVSAVVTRRSPATVPVRSIFTQLSASFSGVSRCRSVRLVPMPTQPCPRVDVLSPRAVVDADPASSVAGATPPAGQGPAGDGDNALVRELVVDFCASVLRQCSADR